jgi:hypothetical protein
MPYRRSNFASATSVSLLPRPRIRDITSDRFALVKMSDIQRLTVISGQRKTPFCFIRLVRKHPVVESRPLRVARIQFLIRQFACVCATPCFGGEAFQYARPAAIRVFVAVRVQAGKKIRDAAPCANKGFVRKFIEWLFQRLPQCLCGGTQTIWNINGIIHTAICFTRFPGVCQDKFSIK